MKPLATETPVSGIRPQIALLRGSHDAKERNRGEFTTMG
jgi:hypothetical protein